MPGSIIIDVRLVRLTNDTVQIYIFTDILSEILEDGEKFLERYNVPKASQEEIQNFITTNIIIAS